MLKNGIKATDATSPRTKSVVLFAISEKNYA